MCQACRVSLQDHLDAPRGGGALARLAACGRGRRRGLRRPGARRRARGGRARRGGRLRRRGCAAARAAGSAVVELVEGTPFLDAARLTGRRRGAPSSAGCCPPSRHAAELAVDALHRALGAAARDGAPRLAASRAAHARGDERRRGQRRRGAAGDRRRRRRGGRDARALVRPGHRRRAQLLLAARGAGRARACPRHGHPARDARPARARSGPRWWTSSWTATPPVARPTPACAATARSASTRCSTWRTRSAPRGSPPATTRGSRATSTVRSCAPEPTRARTRATCWPGSSRRSSSGSRSRSAG